MTVERPGFLLSRYRGRWLVSFNDPERDLTIDKPCYIPDYAASWEPHAYHPRTGEIHMIYPQGVGPGTFRMPDSLWHNLPNMLADKDRRLQPEPPRRPRRDSMLTNKQAQQLKLRQSRV